MSHALLAYVAAATLMVGVFQNCSKASFVETPGSSASGLNVATGSGSSGDASLLVTATPAVVNTGASTLVKAVLTNLTSVAYSCAPPGGGAAAATGNLDPDHSAFDLVVTRDLECKFSGVGPGIGTPVTASLSVSVACGAQFKNGAGSCEDFVCKKVIELGPNSEIPARTAAGECFAVKLIGAIASGASSLTPARDSQVFSRSHDADSSGKTTNPYAMGTSQTQFLLKGERAVKLAGGVSASTPILVDNFVLTGIYPAGTAPNLATAYRVTGSADAAILDGAGASTNQIVFNGTNLPVQAFATGGVSSIAPIDISSFAKPNVMQELDVRALDCGGQRALSDIYVLFQ